MNATNQMLLNQQIMNSSQQPYYGNSGGEVNLFYVILVSSICCYLVVSFSAGFIAADPFGDNSPRKVLLVALFWPFFLIVGAVKVLVNNKW